MNLDRLTQSIKESEGYRKIPYQDTLGFWTVGFGHLIHNDLVQHTGALTFKEFMNYYTDQSRHNQWLERDIQYAAAKAKAWLGDTLWDALTDMRREVLVEMRFQLGNKQEQFLRMKSLLQAHDYDGVAEAMLESLWARQTPQRVHRLAQHIKAG